MIGVVLMNAPAVVFSAEMAGERPRGALTSVVDAGLTLLMSGKARALLMVILGAGAVLAWRAAVRRGGAPMALMLRRYLVLGVLFGVPHLWVFSGDILTHYALAALVLAPLMPLLVAGSRARPLFAAAVFFAVAPVVAAFAPQSHELETVVVLVPQTVGFFCVGVWLARRPETTADASAGPSRLPLRLVVLGLVGHALGLVAMLAADLFFPLELDADGVPVGLGPDGMPPREPGSDMLVSVGGTLMGLGGALLYLGLVWWLVNRGRTSARVLGGLVPLGRMTLTAYLGSTLVFLAVMGPFEGRVPLLAQYGLAAAYFVVVALAARWWARRFLLGPLEWVWRGLTVLRPVPMRRPAAAPVAAAPAGPGEADRTAGTGGGPTRSPQA
ncbi:acyltransferase [Nocardiopsis sp. NRRL B-16309]|nr:acyltransferase [Nocardiopsis sp. NRRL B-16309]